jgi:hypothetical protein
VPFNHGGQKRAERFIFLFDRLLKKLGGIGGIIAVDGTIKDGLLSGWIDCYSHDERRIWRLAVASGRNIEAYFQWVNPSF